MGKALFSLFFMALCQTFVISLFVSPLYVLFLRGPDGAFSLVLAFAVVFISFLVWALFKFGFFTLLLRMVRGEYVTLGFVFYGWRALKRSLPVSLFFAFVLTAFSAALCAGLFLCTDFFDMFAAFFQAEEQAQAAFHFDVKVLIGVVLAIVVLATLFLSLAFLFLSAYDTGNSSLSAALKTNFRLLHKRRLLLVRLLLTAGGRFLLIAFFAFALHTVLVLTTGAEKSSLAKLILNFVYLVNFYTALLRMYFALPVLYEDARAPKIDVLIEDKSDSAVIDETIALLENGTAASDTSENEK